MLPIAESFRSAVLGVIASDEPIERCEHLRSTHDTWIAFYDTAWLLECQDCFNRRGYCSLCGESALGGTWFVYEFSRMTSSKRSDLFAALACGACAPDVPPGNWGVELLMTTVDGRATFLAVTKRTTKARPTCGAG